MTRSELLTAIKAYRDQGYTLEVKLNTTNEALQAEYNRLQAKPVVVAPVVEVLEVAEVAEVTQELAPITEVAEVVEMPTQRNIAAEIVAEAKATDTYWLTWNEAYSRAVDVLQATVIFYKTGDYSDEKLVNAVNAFHDKAVITSTNPTPQPVNFGVLVAFILLECWQVFTSLILPVLGQSFTAVRNTV